MSRDLMKLLIVCGAIVFAVLFGMELSSSGISSVYGPMDPSIAGVHDPIHLGEDTDGAEDMNVNASAGSEDDEYAGGRYADEPEGISMDADEVPMPRLDHTPAIDRLANTAAEALQSVSRGGIQFVVHLFDKTTQ
ncbi:hypothetical protein COLU111180_18755 [Cohnella lubricantis]|uniref:DUF3679 domain-containing protein n=1 Tax=Cohnella lubricantis TaxID=2163172 RepID=A0A841T6U2_9BACL|nr:hypothetical protein [Cohnella lubricantis]MBB6675766.1 hypothetical protein [Cohnella lubricantis]MBP2119841.1 hypothetical protein [Cohnella lubricantis]